MGLGDLVEQATRGRIDRDHLCHEDPMFVDGRCFFGQCGAAQSHLKNQGVGVGDTFLFFGLFADEGTQERHHRIFGYLKVAGLTASADVGAIEPLPRPHPHTLGEWNLNNTIYWGEGCVSRIAHPALRLTQPGGQLRRWIVPEWLGEAGLSFHRNPDRWLGPSLLEIVARGQEFVADVGHREEPQAWLEAIIETIRA